MRRAAAAILLAALAAALPASAPAHRLKEALTTVEWNPRTRSLEVIHQVYAHDVDHTYGGALRAVGGLESLEGRARMALELAGRFRLEDAEGAEIPLETVGAELEAEYFFIYQEAAMDAPPGALIVRDEMLRDQWPDQVNTVNIYYPEATRTLSFSGADGAKPVAP